jgi:hypothetical protein
MDGNEGEKDAKHETGIDENFAESSTIASNKSHTDENVISRFK